MGLSFGQVDYSSEIQPIFNTNCTQCHGASGGLNLGSYDDLMDGGNSDDIIKLPNGKLTTVYHYLNLAKENKVQETISNKKLSDKTNFPITISNKKSVQ